MPYRATTWVHADTIVGSSPIHGVGLFATCNFESGEVLTIVGGKLMSDDDFRRFASRADSYNAIQVDEQSHLVQAAALQGKDVSINHYCDSNLAMLDEVTFAARVPIKSGDELTIDYALFSASGEWLVPPCACGSSFCRLSPNGSDWRLPEVQARYRGQFSPFLNDRIRVIRGEPAV